MSAMMQFFGNDSVALAAALVARNYLAFDDAAVDGSGFVSCHFSPTHSPNPSLAPPGERGEPHVAACLKVGNLRLTVRWPQSQGNTATGRGSQIRPRIGSPALDFAGSRPEAAQSGQALLQRQLAPAYLQPIEGRLNQLLSQFDGNAPLRTFFPPLGTRPNVAVSSLSAPAGVERVGVRGGIQRIKNKEAADNRIGSSAAKVPCVRKEKQKQERTMLLGRGLEPRKLQKIMEKPQFAPASRELTR